MCTNDELAALLREPKGSMSIPMGRISSERATAFGVKYRFATSIAGHSSNMELTHSSLRRSPVALLKIECMMAMFAIRSS